MNQRVVVDIEAAAKMWAEDFSISEIAERFGSSRGMISGIMYRNREIFPVKHKPKPVRTAGTCTWVATPEIQHKRKTQNIGRKIGAINRARIDAAKCEVKDSILALFEDSEVDEVRLPFGKSLIDLESDECRWALNSASPFIFCASDRFKGSSYCAHHMLRSMPKDKAS